MSVQKWLIDNKDKYDDKEDLISACIKSLGSHRDTVVRTLRQLGGVRSNKCKLIGGISSADLRKKLDYRFKIRQAAQSIPEDILFTKSQFKSKFQLTDSFKFKEAEQESEFSKYKGIGSGELYWGNPVTISQFKKEGILV